MIHDANDRQLVFVYGTLKKGYGLNPVLGTDAKMIGDGLLHDHIIYDLGHFPGVSAKDGAGPVVGEVYEVGSRVMPHIDSVESEGSLYRRKRVTVEIEDTGYPNDEVEAWTYIYMGGTPTHDHIASGEWSRDWRKRDRNSTYASSVDCTVCDERIYAQEGIEKWTRVVDGEVICIGCLDPRITLRCADCAAPKGKAHRDYCVITKNHMFFHDVYTTDCELDSLHNLINE
tara:strand:- start:21 stop:707 length:687 start_codon:yes stop_codon:yes gene_type:complete